jgi:hypothetical protein
MKHMKFMQAEYILGIQRLRNEVFTEDSKTLCVLGSNKLNAISQFIKDETTALGYKRRVFTLDTTGTYNKLKLEGSYHFQYNLGDDEIILVKGYDVIDIVNELGEPVAHDYEIDIMYDIQMLEELEEGKLC